jgi:hypothetical protein
MAIRTLSTREWDRFRPARTTMAQRLTDHAVEWFADDTGAVLGAIAYETPDLAWSVVILGRDTLGQFCAFDRDISIGRLVDARRLLVDRMTVAVAIVKRAPPGRHSDYRAHQK